MEKVLYLYKDLYKICANINVMIVISSGEFRANQKDYLDKVDNGVSLMIQRGKKRAYRIVPVTETDVINDIPVEHRADPFKVSPSGDAFWADKRNIDILVKAVELLKRQGFIGTHKMSKEEQRDLLGAGR